jgi:hypothetical protein
LLFINKKATKMNEEKIARHLTFMQHPGKWKIREMKNCWRGVHENHAKFSGVS